MANPVYRRAIERAAHVCGGAAQLAERIDVSEARIRFFLDGHAEIPMEVFLRVIDVVLDAEIGALREHRSSTAANDIP